MNKTLFITAIVLFAQLCTCNAEKIICTNGQTVIGNVTSRTAESTTVEIQDKYSGKPISVPFKNHEIDKILNNDGTISKFDYRSLFKASQEFLDQRKYPQAIATYNSLLESFPDNMQIHYLRAILNHKLGNLNEALSDYSLLAEHNAADAVIFNNMGAIYAGKKEYQKALDCLDKAIAKDANMTEALNNRAEVVQEIEKSQHGN